MTQEMTSISIEEGLNFIVSHFIEQFPRKISSKTSENRQILIFNKEEALARFKAANFLDCKINAYPYVKRWKGWEGKNRQKPNLLLIDKDSNNFKTRADLDNSLNNTLSRMQDKLGSDTNPSVIWSGHGYHIIQPLDAILLEEESEFNKFEQPSRGFLRFAEKYLSSDEADKCHYETTSFNNCMLRIPGSFNAKSKLEEVKIIQPWNGYRPSIKGRILLDCYLQLQEWKINRLEHRHPSGFCRYWRKQ